MQQGPAHQTVHGGPSPCYAVRQWRFDKSQAKWFMLTPNQEAAVGSVKKETLKVLTYNIFFGDVARRTRYREILRMLPDLDPDVVCIQEAVGDWIYEMINDSYVQANYFISDVDGRTLQGYGVVLMSKIPIRHLNMWWLPTNMGRTSLIATYTINDETVSVGTVHLESLDNSEMREAQLAVIARALSRSPHACLVGDFNFDAETNYWRQGSLPLENDVLGRHYPDYVDVWATLQPDLKGHTFDSDVNKMIVGREQCRYDRAMWKSTKWQPQRIEMVGTAPLPNLKTVWPSDHFGLLVEFKLD